MRRFFVGLSLVVSGYATGSTVTLQPGEQISVSGTTVVCSAEDNTNELPRNYNDMLTGKKWFFVGTSIGTLASQTCGQANYRLPEAVEMTLVHDRLMTSAVGQIIKRASEDLGQTLPTAWIEPATSGAPNYFYLDSGHTTVSRPNIAALLICVK